jgi:hypothetical protein
MLAHLVHQHRGFAEALLMAEFEICVKPCSPEDNALDAALLVKVEIGTMNVPPHVGAVLENVESMHRRSRLVEEGTGPIDKVRFYIFPRAGKSMPPNTPCMHMHWADKVFVENIFRDPNVICWKNLQNPQ